MAASPSSVCRVSAFVLRDRVHPELLQVLDRGAEPHRFGDWRSPGLEAPGQVVPLGPVDPDLFDHLAPAASRLQSLQDLAAPVEDTEAGGPEHLVGREGVKITIKSAHIE